MRPSVLGLGLSAVLAAAGPACQRPAAPTLPRPDLAQAEPAVAAAVNAALEAAGRKSDDPAAWGRLGLVLDAHGLRAEAVVAYSRAEVLAPRDARWPAHRADDLPEDAADERLASLERASALDPRSPWISLRLGEAALELGRLDVAARAFTAALDAVPAAAGAEPCATRALLGLARVELAEGDRPAARTLLVRARDADPTHRPAHALLAPLLVELGDEEGARASVSAARTLPAPPPLPDPLRAEVEAAGASALHRAIRGSALLRSGAAAAAIPELEAAVAARPDLVPARVELGQARLLAGQVENGLSTLREAAARAPHDPAPKRSLAAALAAVGDLEGALALAREVLSAVPDDADLRLRASEFLLALGRGAEAVQLCEAGLARAGAPPALRQRLALLLATSPDDALRDGPRARELARELCRVEPSLTHLEALACALAECRDFPGALDALARAAELDRSVESGAREEIHAAWRALFSAGRAVRY